MFGKHYSSNLCPLTYPYESTHFSLLFHCDSLRLHTMRSLPCLLYSHNFHHNLYLFLYLPPAGSSFSYCHVAISLSNFNSLLSIHVRLIPLLTSPFIRDNPFKQVVVKSTFFPLNNLTSISFEEPLSFLPSSRI